MKFNKIFIALIPSLVLCSISSCSTNNSTDIKTNSNIIISEYFCGEVYYDSAIELSNISSEDISLSGYKLNIFSKGEIKTTIELNETIKANSCFVYANKGFSNSTNLVDIKVLDDNILTGKNHIELVDSKSNLLDCIGLKDYDISYANNESLVRLKEYYNGYKEYNYLQYVRVKANLKTYLGNQNAPLTVDELMDGPKLTSVYSNLDFTNSTESALGGYVNVSIVSLGDGDTTVFKYDSKSNLNELTQRTRYLMINTPEVDHGPESTIVEEKWGKTAEIYNNDRLNKAKHIIVQSNKGYGLRETYGRLLGYVWYTDKENPTLSDYKLLNHEMVIQGLARFDSRDKYETMYTDDVLYYEYFMYAYEYASQNQIKLYGNDDDPNFNK